MTSIQARAAAARAHAESRERLSPPTRAILPLLRGGKPSRELALRIDLLRAVGAVELVSGTRQAKAFREADVDAAVYRDIWSRAAAARGAEFHDFGRSFFQITDDGRTTLVCRHLVKLDDAVTVELALDKPLVQQMLAAQGLHVPPSVVVTADRWADSVDFVSTMGSCVVKPATKTSGGIGVTGGVQTRDDLVRACVRAARYDDLVLVEQQVTGAEYRFLLLDGEVLDVLVRTSPSVVGDGRSTIAQLIRQENARRLQARGNQGLWPIRADLDCALTLRNNGLSLRAVLPAGQRVPVKSTANEGGARECRRVIDFPRELLDQACRATSVLGARFCSVELIAHADRGSGVVASILEVNGTPGLHYHYQVSNPDGVDVAGRLLATLLDRERSALPDDAPRHAAAG